MHNGWLTRIGCRQFLAGLVLFSACASLSAQTTIAGAGPGGTVRIFGSDMAILEVPEPRTDLPCVATAVKPQLGFDLRYHVGYEVTIPLRELAGAENLLTVLFRVIPENRKDEPLYMTQRVRVPAIEEDAKGDAFFQGVFDVGEGNYHVDWLLRDRTERVCSSYWDVTAELPAKDKQVNLVIPPGIVQAADSEQFKEEPPVERAQNEAPLNVKVLINFAPQNPNAPMLQPMDTSALVSILRSIAREPRITRFSLVAFNLQEQRIVYRQDSADCIDFPKLGDALKSVTPGTIDLKRLEQKHGDTQFLTQLIRNETTGVNHPDALIFAGPKVMLDENVEQNDLAAIGQLDYPVFYMNYNLNPQAVPWRDSISRAVKFFRGQEYTISRPRDVWFAVSEMMSHIVKSKHLHRSADASTQ